MNYYDSILETFSGIPMILFFRKKFLKLYKPFYLGDMQMI